MHYYLLCFIDTYISPNTTPSRALIQPKIQKFSLFLPPIILNHGHLEGCLPLQASSLAYFSFAISCFRYVGLGHTISDGVIQPFEWTKSYKMRMSTWASSCFIFGSSPVYNLAISSYQSVVNFCVATTSLCNIWIFLTNL